MCVCTPGCRTPFCGKPGCEWPPQKPKMYTTDAGEEKRDRRRKDRDNDDPRIEHLFNGLDKCIASAEANGDKYEVGYMTAMRQEFGQLIAALVR
jgi:hypothetical protein